jgi:hypothetical protein
MVFIRNGKVLRIGKRDGKIVVEFSIDNRLIYDLLDSVDIDTEIEDNFKEDIANVILNNFNLKDYRERIKEFIQRNNLQMYLNFNKISKINYESYDELDKAIEFYQVISELGIKTPENLNKFTNMLNDAVKKELEEDKYFTDRKCDAVVRLFNLYSIVKEEDLKNEILKIAKETFGDVIRQIDERDIYRWRRRRSYFNGLSFVLRAIDSISKMGYYDLIKGEVEELRLKLVPNLDENFKRLIAKRVSSEEKDGDIKREAQVLIKILREKSLLSYLV